MDVIHWLRMVLDTLGFDLFDIPLPLYNAANRLQHRWKRSCLRKIGSKCDFLHVPRIHFQEHLLGFHDESLQSSSMPAACPNLGDIVWVLDEPHESFTKLRSDMFNLINTSTQQPIKRREMLFSAGEFTCSTPDTSKISRSMSLVTNDIVTMDKISALEEELSKLREMLVGIAMKPSMPDVVPTEVTSPTILSETVPNISKVSPPQFASKIPSPPVCLGIPPPPVPTCAGGLAPPAPPPPPPPLPKMTPTNSAKSVKDIIKENKLKNGKSMLTSSKKKPPNMGDVLKGLGSVKLRSISRSPGGTPLHKREAKQQEPIDAASLIARALKKKFAHSVAYSPDKENQDENAFSPSPNKHSPKIAKPQERSTSGWHEHRYKHIVL